MWLVSLGLLLGLAAAGMAGWRMPWGNQSNWRIVEETATPAAHAEVDLCEAMRAAADVFDFPLTSEAKKYDDERRALKYALGNCFPVVPSKSRWRLDVLRFGNLLPEELRGDWLWDALMFVQSKTHQEQKMEYVEEMRAAGFEDRAIEAVFSSPMETAAAVFNISWDGPQSVSAYAYWTELATASFNKELEAWCDRVERRNSVASYPRPELRTIPRGWLPK